MQHWASAATQLFRPWGGQRVERGSSGTPISQLFASFKICTLVKMEMPDAYLALRNVTNPHWLVFFFTVTTCGNMTSIVYGIYFQASWPFPPLLTPDSLTALSPLGQGRVVDNLYWFQRVKEKQAELTSSKFNVSSLSHQSIKLVF